MSELWVNTNKCYIVNGCIDKTDANFLKQFSINPIGETNVLIGSHPLSQLDVAELKKEGITAVLDL